MKLSNHKLAWAVFLLGSGVFLLLKGLGVFKDYGEALWGGMFVLVGAGFVAWFLIDRQRSWRAIAGFPLLAIGALILLGWRGVSLGDWQAALVLFGVALGFWTVLLAHDDNWWALIPAGVFTLMGLLIGFQARLSEDTWLGFFFVGLAAVFGLLYLLRLGQKDTAWAGIPAAAFLLVGVVTLVDASGTTGIVTQWWPVLLLVLGAVLLVFALHRAEVVPPPMPASEPIQPFPSPSTPATERPASVTPAPASDQPLDIYSVLAQQPADDKSKE